MSHLASDYTHILQEGPTTPVLQEGRPLEKKGVFVGILNEDELLPNNNQAFKRRDGVVFTFD